ncbi:TetR family transcriptional regulator [Paraoerskovia sediminicola]|uniref:TetR family transcriptional regulator n=1 Tax=Paraoerskovia sediminicola TaxID=1138587 RepID=A0ABM8G0R8_9CELL|nr:TetR/AcrR family transcriptional regulator [Paraoerskovia sediminicola]BDZ41607.1 TetR family transcriptional regulator [Paraoerskovia sediminicola]
MPTEKSPEGPRGYAKGRRKREQIIESATAMFGEVGYNSASLREISARVGISHPGLLHHFPTKADLLAAVLQHRDEADNELLQADLEGGYDFFQALVRLVERNQQRPGIVELYSSLSAEATSPGHPAHEYFQNRYDMTITAMRTEIESRITAGEMPAATDPDSTARAVVALMDGLQIQWLLGRDAQGPRVDMAQVLLDHLRLVARIDMTVAVPAPASDAAPARA